MLMILLLCSAGLNGWAATLTANSADGAVDATSVVDTGNWNAPVGKLGTARAYIIPFQLPTLEVGENFDTADLRMMLYGQNSSGFSVDVYGLPRVSASPAIESGDFYIGSFDSSATLIQDNFFTTSSPGLGTPVNSDATGDANLKLWLNARYNNGANAGQYVFIRLSADVNPGGDLRFEVLTQNAGGATEKPLITYTAAAYVPPDIGVLGLTSLAIVNGDATPSTLDGTDFGSLDLTSSGFSRTFTVTNSGSGLLSLSGSTRVTVTGSQASDFVVTTQPAASLAGGSVSTFTVRFIPSAIGLRQATLTIANDDPDENPYTFSIQGTGTFSASAFPYRIPIQFCGYSKSEMLTNFPALVKLGGHITNFTYGGFLSGSGHDIRFTDDGQTRLLNHEIESWNTGGDSHVWVQVPTLAGSTTTIWAMWGNAAAASAPIYATNGASWTESFAGVWHLGETSGNSRDSTTNALTGYPSNGVTQTASGQVGDADDFGGSGSRTFLGTPAALNNLTRNFSVSAWIRPDALGGNRVIFGSHWGSFNGWSLRIAGANLALERLGPNTTYNSGVAVTASQWAAVAAVYDSADDVTFYINGVAVSTISGTDPATPSTQPWSIGANTGDNFDGIIDEVQVSQIARSSNWIWAAYQNTMSNSTFVCPGTLLGPGDLLILGTNGASIASGSTATSEANGTDYGLVAVSSFRDHTFILTNAGVGSLSISGVTTSGAHKANFSVRSFPSTINGFTSSNLIIRFTPPGSGIRTAVVTVVSNDEDTPSYSFTLVGSDSSAGISVTPATYAPKGELGSTFTPVLSVTNTGSISIPYSFTSDVPWITSNDAGLPFNNGPMAGQSHALSITFTNPICAAGVYTGRVVVTAPLATNSPWVLTIVATATPPAKPTAVTANASGQEMVRLAWTPTSGNPVMIVYREGSWPSTHPSGCSSYAMGDNLGDGTVIYYGSESSLEHITTSGATHYYRVYSVSSGHFYSVETDLVATTTDYGDGILLAENFSYTNGVSLGSRNGGYGWTNAWSAGGAYLISTSSLSAITGFAGGAGNAATNSVGGQLFRGLPQMSSSSGRIYLSFQMHYLGAGYAGMSLFDGVNEQWFIGQRSAAHEFGLVYYGGSSPSLGVNSMVVGKDYTIMAMLDIANGTMSASIYTNESNTIPSAEPTMWQVMGTGPTTSVFNRIRLGSGVGAAFDEIRMGHSWRDVLDATPYVVDVLPTQLTFNATAGSPSSNMTFQIANGSASVFGYTNAITYGAGATGWLHLNNTNGSLTAFSSVTHTAFVSAIGGGGSYAATNRITTPFGTFTQRITVVVSGVPSPSSASVVADGPQLRRLAWADSNNRNVMIVYRSGSAPAAEPVQGASYSVGSVIPGSGATVISIATNGSREHIIAPGTAGYYKFYAVNSGIYYSTGLLFSTAAIAYPPNVIVDHLAATQGVALATVASGQGWSGPWSVTDASGSFTVVTNIAAGTPSFTSFNGYPTSSAHRIKMSNQGNGNTGIAVREFAAISSGKLYVSTIMSYQYPGAQKFAGLSLLSSGTEKFFVGETSGGGGVLGVDSFGGSGVYNSGYDLRGFGENIGNIYLIIASYDFASRELKAMAYHTSEAVPAGEPDTWLLTTNLPAGRISSLNGIRLLAGCSDGGNTVGDTYFDEVRVARSWGNLVEQTGPVLSSFSMNNEMPVTDAQMTGGTWSVTMDFYDPAGLDAASANYDLFNSNAVALASDLSFSTFAHTLGGQRLIASNGTHGAMSDANLYLGPYILRWSIENSNGVGVVNSSSDTNFGIVGFNVVDDDTAGPVASGFNVTGIEYYDSDLSSGLLVTGLIQDIGSGIWGGSSNRYVLYRNSSQVASGAFDIAPGSDGAAQSTPEALSVTLPASVVTNVGSYLFVVFSHDYDTDRTGDSASGSNSFAFSVNYFGCPAGFTPRLNTLVDKTATSTMAFAFSVTANDTGCSAPNLAAYGLPAGASFTTSTAGTNQVGTFSWTPPGTGTFPVKFTANDGVLSTSVIIRIYVGSSGEPVNGQGIPHSQTNWSIPIIDVAVPSSGNATVQWSSTDGMSYDVYTSTQPLGGGASWSKVVQGHEADGSSTDVEVVGDGGMRFYQVVPEGSARTDRGVWGIVRPSVPAGISYQSIPLVTDRAFDGEMGTVLAESLPQNTLIYIMSAGAVPSWTTLRLNGSGLWVIDGTSTEYTIPLAAGQAFMVSRPSGSTSPTFTGPVGNDGTGEITLAQGYNIIGISEGKTLAAGSAFETASPVGSFDESLADQVVIMNSNGSWRRLIRRPNGTWYDTANPNSSANTSMTLTPGQGYYYIRRGANTDVRF
jgi:hypothetical protein